MTSKLNPARTHGTSDVVQSVSVHHPSLCTEAARKRRLSAGSSAAEAPFDAAAPLAALSSRVSDDGAFCSANGEGQEKPIGQ